MKKQISVTKRAEFKRRLKKEMKRKVVETGRTDDEKRKKAEWFKKHVIIDMA